MDHQDISDVFPDNSIVVNFSTAKTTTINTQTSSQTIGQCYDDSLSNHRSLPPISYFFSYQPQQQQQIDENTQEEDSILLTLSLLTEIKEYQNNVHEQAYQPIMTFEQFNVHFIDSMQIFYSIPSLVKFLSDSSTIDIDNLHEEEQSNEANVLTLDVQSFDQFSIQSLGFTNSNHHQTYELPLWPCLRRLSILTLLSIDRFYSVDKGHSMFVLTKLGCVYLFAHNSNTGEMIFHFPRRIISLQSFCSKYLHFITEDHELYVWAEKGFKDVILGLENNLTIRQDESLFINEPRLLLKDIVKFRFNHRQCLALNSQGILFTWGTFLNFQQKHFIKYIQSTPMSINHLFSSNNYQKTTILDFDCGKFGSFALISVFSSDLLNQKVQHLYSWDCNWWLQNNKNHTSQHDSTRHFKSKVLGQNSIKNVIVGHQTFLLLSNDGLVFYYNYQQQNNIELFEQIRTEYRFVRCFSIPSTDTFILITSNDHWFIWNHLNRGQLSPTHLRSLPDLFSFYGRYPSTPDLTFIAPEALNNPEEIYSLQTFNNPFDFNFKIQIPFDSKTTRIIFASKIVLIQRCQYFRHLLLKQFPNLDETVEFEYSFLEHYYFVKKLYTTEFWSPDSFKIDSDYRDFQEKIIKLESRSLGFSEGVGKSCQNSRFI